MSQNSRFLRDFAKNAGVNLLIFSALAAAYFFLVKFLQANSQMFYPLQAIEAKIVYLIQKPFTDVVLSGSKLLYQGFIVNVSWDCLGLRQSVFFLILVFSFYQIELDRKLKSLYFVPIIILANILRIAVLYPLFVVLGAERTVLIHEFLYAYGNGILILLLFALWFYVFGLQKSKHKRKR